MKLPHFKLEFLEGLPPDVTEALAAMALEYERLVTTATQQSAGKPGGIAIYHQDFVEALSIFAAFCQDRELDLKVPDIGVDAPTDVRVILTFLNNQSQIWKSALFQRVEKQSLVDKTNFYSDIFSKSQFYTIPPADSATIQDLINQLRMLITESQIISKPHKLRLLRRLEKVQVELHQPMSELEQIWGLIGESGIVLSKFGGDLKPISDRVAQIGQIILKVILAKEGVKEVAAPMLQKLLGP